MNNKPENVPIATLSGLTSITDVLKELSLPDVMGNENGQVYNLISSPEMLQEARKLLNNEQFDGSLVQRLQCYLSKVNTSYLDFKDPAQQRFSEFTRGSIPVLLQQILSTAPHIFTPNYQEYVSPSKFLNKDFITPNQSPDSSFQRPHGPSLILSPTRSGYNIPVAYVSPLRHQAHPNTPVAHVPPYNIKESSSRQLDHRENKDARTEASTSIQNQEVQEFSPLKTRHQRNAELSVSAPGQLNTTSNVLSQDHEKLATDVSRTLPKRNSRRSLTLQDNVRRQLYEEIESSKPSEGVKKTSNREHRNTKDERRIEHVLESPSKSLKISINTDDLYKKPDARFSQKRSESKHEVNVSAESSPINRPIGIDGITLQEPEMRYNKEGKSTYIMPSNLPTDILIEHTEMRPVVPKIIVKKIKRKQGSKEFETMEIISPEKDATQVEQMQPDILTTNLTSINLETIVSNEEAVTVSALSKKNETLISDNRSLSKKRRRTSSESDKSNENEPMDLQQNEAFPKRQKRNKIMLPDHGTDMRTDTRRIMQIIQEILDFEDQLASDGILTFEDGCDVPPDSLLPRPLVTDLYMEISKLKSSNLAAQISHEQLAMVVTIMARHVKECAHAVLAQHKDDEDEEEKMWKLLKVDRVLRASEAALVILHITTAPDMPKQVFMEEAIDHVVSFCRSQLENTIYPEYDPVYRIDPDSKFDTSVLPPKSRRGRSVASTKQKPILQLYNKLCEIVSLIGDLVSIENMTDMIILQVSKIGTAPFFVENVSILQLEALKLVRTIFRTYVRHRDLILDDILASLARLPSSKRNLRSYRLFEETSIQMVTALVLQLVQCTVTIPETFEKQGDLLVDKDVMIVSSYEDSIRAAQNFLSTFLKKCSTVSKDENDFRPLFENFLHDILTTLNKPEWPAAEIILTLLGKLLIVTFNNKSNEISLRVSAMDYLALITSHLRRDAVDSRDKDKDDLKEIIQQLNADDEIEDEISVDMIDIHVNSLRKALLNFLSDGADADTSYKFAKEFYLGQWIRDVQIEMEKCMKAPMMSIPGAASSEIPTEASDPSMENIQELDEKKKYYHSLATGSTVTSFRSSQKKLTYQEACIVAKYLSSTHSFCQSFDIYLQQIFKMLNEPAVALRTKAVKALASIVSVDPNILGREDVQVSVHCRFRDQSTLVREAAVDLIGQFVLKCPDITDKYYDMITERILDTGISVRKRVIKILRDICVEQPEYSKVPEICVKIIRRVNDEEGIRDLVTKVFQKMWFTPLTDNTHSSQELETKAVNIIKVVAMCKDCGYDWFENLLENLLESDDQNVKTSTIKACQQLVDCLVQKMIKTEQEKGAELVSCLTALYLLCKIRPQLFIQHASTFQPYLSIKCKTQGDALVIQNVSRILENVIPLIEHPNPKFLADIEEDLMKLMLKQGQNVVQSCISCLDAVINQVTHNYKFVLDCFRRFHDFLSKAKNEYSSGAQASKLANTRPALLRSLFVAGLLCKHFDFDKHVAEKNKKALSLDLLDISLFFAKSMDEEVRLKAIMAVGFICVTKPEYLLRNECKSLYQNILSDNYKSDRGKSMLLKGLLNHLMEEESRMNKLEGRKKRNKKQKEQGDIKEFGDVQSGTTSAVMQVLLKNILESFFQIDTTVRLAAVQVIGLILKQGLIHPAQCVPYLIAAGSDNIKMIKSKAEQALADIHKRHSGFIHMKAVQGIKLSYKLQKLLHCTNGGYLQGYQVLDSKAALISHVYTMLRSNKQYRRPFLQSILKQFDDQKCPIDMLYFFAENLAYLPYNTQEEPLFVVHHCDMIVSLNGPGYTQSFHEIFFPTRKGKGKSPNHAVDEDELEQSDKLTELPVDMKRLQTVCKESFGCMLLLELKHFLKQLYGLANSKCQKYSPSEPSKLYDKSLTRRCEMDFNSHFKDLMFNAEELDRNGILTYFSELKQLMLSLDSEEDNEEVEVKEKCLEMKRNDNVKGSVSGDIESEEKPAAMKRSENLRESIAQAALPVDINLPTEPNEQLLIQPDKLKSQGVVMHSETEAAEHIDDDATSEGSSNNKSTRRSSRSRK